MGHSPLAIPPEQKAAATGYLIYTIVTPSKLNDHVSATFPLQAQKGFVHPHSCANSIKYCRSWCSGWIEVLRGSGHKRRWCSLTG
jgi:hypothetical protein